MRCYIAVFVVFLLWPGNEWRGKRLVGCGLSMCVCFSLDVDFLESECTNHVAGSTYTPDLLYQVQADEPSSSPTLVPPTVQPLPTPELKPLSVNLKYAYLEDKEKFLVIISASLAVE